MPESMPVTEKARRNFASRIEEYEPSLIIFDSWINFLEEARLDENVSNDISRWSKIYIHPARERNVTVVILDHVPKEGTGARGSGRKKEEVDVQWELRGDSFGKDKKAKLVLKKHKDRRSSLKENVEFRIGGSGENFVFDRLDIPNSGLTGQSKVVYDALAKNFAEGGAKAGEWHKASGTGESTFHECRNRLIANGYVEKRPDTRSGKYYPKKDLS